MHGPHGGRHAAVRRSSAAPKVRRLARALGTLTIVCVVAGIGVGKLAFHVGLSPVLTGSMRPTFAPGDALVTRPVPVTQLHPGMVVVFVPPGHADAYAHRIVSLGGTPTRPVITTKGDANPAPDRWRVTLSTPTVQYVVGSVPKAGQALVWLHEPRWRAGVIGVLGLLMTTLLTRSVLRTTPAPLRGPAHAR